MTSREISEIFVNNINLKLSELFEDINKQISPIKIEHEEIFGIEWVESLQDAIDGNLEKRK